MLTALMSDWLSDTVQGHLPRDDAAYRWLGHPTSTINHIIPHRHDHSPGLVWATIPQLRLLQKAKAWVGWDEKGYKKGNFWEEKLAFWESREGIE